MMNAGEDCTRQRPQPSNSVHCYCCPYARPVGVVDNHISGDAGIVDYGYRDNGYEYVGDDVIQLAAANVDEVRRRCVGDKRSRSYGYLPVGAARNDRSTASSAEAANRIQLPRRQRSGQYDVHYAIGQASVVSPATDGLAFAPVVDNYVQRKRLSGTGVDVVRDGCRQSATEKTMENSRCDVTMLGEARLDTRAGLSAQHVGGQHERFIGRGDVGGRITSTALPRRPDRLTSIHSVYDVSNDVSNCDLITSLANEVLSSVDRNKEVVLTVETLHRLLIGSSLYQAVRPLINSDQVVGTTSGSTSTTRAAEKQLNDDLTGNSNIRPPDLIRNLANDNALADTTSGIAFLPSHACYTDTGLVSQTACSIGPFSHRDQNSRTAFHSVETSKPPVFDNIDDSSCARNDLRPRRGCQLPVDAMKPKTIGDRQTRVPVISDERTSQSHLVDYRSAAEDVQLKVTSMIEDPATSRHHRRRQQQRHLSPAVRTAATTTSVTTQLNNITTSTSSTGHFPEPPINVTLTVSGRCALLVKFDRPAIIAGGTETSVTRHIVEWSYFDNFSRIVGSHVIGETTRDLGHEITDLEPGNRYYIRVRAGNAAGFGSPAFSTPSSATPSNWRDFEEGTARYEGKLQIFEGLHERLLSLNAIGSSAVSSLKHVETSSSKMRKTIKNLFASGVKLQKTLKKGLYIAALVHYEGRVLVTNDDVIPTVEVECENTTPAKLNSDLFWLMKVTSSWYDLKSLQQQLAKCTNSSSLQFRGRLLFAILQLQSAIGLHDLGQFHYAPSYDLSTGSTVLVAVRSLSDAKAVDTSRGVRWMSLRKVALPPRGPASGTPLDVTARQRQVSTAAATDGDGWRTLLESAHGMIVEGCLGGQVLPRGLYVGYLKLTCGSGSAGNSGLDRTSAASTKDSVNVVVPRHQPNVLPYVKVRDNPNITSEEWRWLVNEKLQANSLWLNPIPRCPTDVQQSFETELLSACDRLLLEIGDERADGGQKGDGCRLYDAEVLELNADVSFVVVLPPSERVCDSPLDEYNSGSHELPKPFSSLPVQAFELLHLQAYQPDMSRRYCQLSATIEVELSLAQHELRQALTTDDIERLRHRVDGLTRLQTAANDAWKVVRWLPDLTCYARDRANSVYGVNAGSSGFLSSQQQQQLGSPSSPTVRGLPLAALFGPAFAVQDVSDRRQHHPKTSTEAAAEPSRHRQLTPTAKSGTVSGPERLVRDGGSSVTCAAAATAGSSSIIGSDSDYHSDISSFSVEYFQSATATAATVSASAVPVLCQFQPVLL